MRFFLFVFKETFLISSKGKCLSCWVTVELALMGGRLSRLLNRSKVARPGGHHGTTMRVDISECRDNISEHIKNKKSVKRSKSSQTKPSSSAKGGAVELACWFCSFVAHLFNFDQSYV